MSAKRWPRKGRPAAPRARGSLLPLLLLMLAAGIIALSLYLRSLATELAVSMAQDKVVAAVNEIVKEEISAADGKYGSLIQLEKTESGDICAVTTNMAAVNELTSDILMGIVKATADHEMTVSIPVGSLTGSTLLLSRGPDIKVIIQVLSSSFTGFRSDLTSIGINQTRHQILLELKEEITLIMPWHTVTTSVSTEIPVADTIIVGQVPQSYLNWGE